MKLTQDDKELIAGMLASNEWQAVMKAMEIVVERLRVRVVTTNVDSNGRDIVLRKKELEGALQVVRYMNDIKYELRKEGLDG